MTDTSPNEMELTPELLEYARAVALKEARKHCPPHVSFDDAAQEAVLHLMSRPPRFDPARGANEKTLIFLVVQRAVLKFVARESLRAARFKQFDEPDEASDGAGGDQIPEHEKIVERRTAELTRTQWALEDVLQYVDSEESRSLCRLVMECGGNVSEAARRLGVVEGTVRKRLKLLAPKLRAAGFDPFSIGDR